MQTPLPTTEEFLTRYGDTIDDRVAEAVALVAHDVTAAQPRAQPDGVRGRPVRALGALLHLDAPFGHRYRA